ncbi:MAG: TVP38/TMEM64 family protein [Myxococcales bacterium]|nr:TVP38/TMEM64 family protein [Myxococcales bacterium]
MFKRIAVLAGIAAIVGGLYYFGLLDLVKDPERARAALEGLGIWAPILYVLAFSCLQSFFVPGIAFVIPGAIFFSFPVLFALSWLGSVGAGIVAFSFARFMGREFVEKRLPERMRAYDERLVTKGLQTVILVRLTLFITPLAHWLLGLSQVRFTPFLIGTAIGFIPGMALLTYFVVFVGESLGDWIADRPPWFFAGVALVVIVFIRLRRTLAKRRERAPRSDAKDHIPAA